MPLHLLIRKGRLSTAVYSFAVSVTFLPSKSPEVCLPESQTIFGSHRLLSVRAYLQGVYPPA